MSIRTALVPLLIAPLALVACETGGDDADTDTDTDASTTDTTSDDTDDASSDDDDTTDDTDGASDDTDVEPQAISAEDYEGTWHVDTTTGTPCEAITLQQVEVTASSATVFSVNNGQVDIPCMSDPTGAFSCAIPALNVTRFVVVDSNVSNCGASVSTTLTGQLGDGEVTVNLDQTLTPLSWGAYVACPSNYATTCTATYGLLSGPTPEDTDIVIEAQR